MPRSVSHPYVQQNKLRKKNPGETRPSAPKGHKLSGKRTGFGRNSGKVKCVRIEQAPAPPTRQLLSAGYDSSDLCVERGNLSGTKTGKAYSREAICLFVSRRNLV